MSDRATQPGTVYLNAEQWRTLDDIRVSRQWGGVRLRRQRAASGWVVIAKHGPRKYQLLTRGGYKVLP